MTPIDKEVAEKCKVDGCTGKGQMKAGRRYFVRGLCHKHYQRWYFHKDVNMLKIIVTGHRKNHPLYDTYIGMLYRCYNTTQDAYKHYGGRGIKVCDRWLGIEGFENFIKDMGEKPFPSYSLDRIDVNGNYDPDNVRWASKSVQAQNKRIKNPFGYPGITFVKRPRRGDAYMARINREGKSITIGMFDTADKAIKARKAAEAQLNNSNKEKL